MIFVQDQYRYLTKNIECASYQVTHFVNQEVAIQLQENVTLQQCVVIGSLTAPAEQALELLCLLHTIFRYNPTELILISPYLGYQRQDNVKDYQSFGLQWADTLLYAIGVKKIITIEPHNSVSLSLLHIPVFAYSSQLIFEQDMALFVNAGFSFIFPDQGSILRYQWILQTFPSTDFGVFQKQRLQDMIIVQNFSGKVGKKVIVYDDILDTGQTLVQVCIALRQMGVEEIVIFVTHAFFYGHIWNQLWDCGVRVLYCTNSVPIAEKMQSSHIVVKSIDFLLQKSL